MKNTIIRCLCVVWFGLLAVPGAANAQNEAYTNAPANLRAGPAPDYPLVAQIPGGTLVSVLGCLDDYTWCDVALPGVRGWIYAGLLSYPYQGGEVPLLEYGATIGFPVVVFAIGPYWDHYYRNRPWYHDRDRWMRRAEPRIGPGGVPPGRERPQFGGHPPGVPVAPGGRQFDRTEHDTRPSATRGGWSGGMRSPAPVPAPAPAPAPPAGGGIRAPGPPAAVHAPAPSGGGAVRMPPQGHQGGGGERAFGHQGGGGGGERGGGGGERGNGQDFRRN